MNNVDFATAMENRKSNLHHIITLGFKFDDAIRRSK